MDLEFPNRETFEAKLESIISQKRGDNSGYLSAEKYEEIIREVKRGRRPGMTKTDYRRLQRYATIEHKGKDTLIVPVSDSNQPMKQYVKNEDLYDKLLTAHKATGHGVRNKMIPALNTKYANISAETILFLSLCGKCLSKRQAKRRGIVVKPLVFKQMNDSVQIDLIDFQSKPDGEYKWVFNYQGHLTRKQIIAAEGNR